MDRKKYYWIVATLTNDNGQNTPFLIYGGETEEAARQRGIEQVGSNFQIKPFPTRNLSAASAFFRGKRLDETHDLRESSRRIKHTMNRRQV